MNLPRPRKLLLVAAALAGLATSSYAHRLWLLPSTSVLSGKDQWISVEGAVSNNLFFPNHRPLRLSGVTCLSPSGKSVPLSSVTEGEIRSSFEVLLEEEGSYRIGSGGKSMFASWEENGERKRRRGSPEELAALNLAQYDKAQIREGINRVETIVTCGSPTEIAPSGEGLEFEFISHPNDLFMGETATFRVLLDGKPSAGQTVTIVKGDDRFRNEAGQVELTSDEEGLIEIDWSEPGRYWINSRASLPDGEFEGISTRRSASYTLTLEVLPE